MNLLLDGIPHFPSVVYNELQRGDINETLQGIGGMIEEALTREQSTNLRISDSGMCTRKVWAKIHGKNDIPEDPDTMWARLHLGTIVGAYHAKVFARGVQRLGWHCGLEGDVKHRGVPGHIDAYVISPDKKKLHLYEFKSNYSTSPNGSKSYHWKQLDKYTLALSANFEAAGELASVTNSVVMAYPAIYANKGLRLEEYRRTLEDMSQGFVAAEDDATRLARSTGKEMPAADPDPNLSWMCKSGCLFSACEKNKNKSEALL